MGVGLGAGEAARSSAGEDRRPDYVPDDQLQRAGYRMECLAAGHRIAGSHHRFSDRTADFSYAIHRQKSIPPGLRGASVYSVDAGRIDPLESKSLRGDKWGRGFLTGFA